MYFKYLVVFILSLPVFAEYTFKVQPLPGMINTELQEFGPSLSSDGRTLYFYSKRYGKYTDIFYTKKKKDGSWTPPAILRGVNSPYDDQSPHISQEGKFMIFSSNRDGSIEFRLPDGRLGVSRDLYYTEYRNAKWTKPVRMPLNVNTKDIEENPFVHADGLYFTRYPFGKPYEAKIYKLKLEGNALSKEKAVPLPSPVNEEGSASIATIISKDGKELYFSSNRKGGYGGFDIYKVKINEDGSFGKAENLGPEINTEGDEAFMVIDESDKSLIFCRKEIGKSYDLYSGKEVPKDDIALILKIKKKISLNNIHFDINSHTLKSESLPELDKLVKYLQEYKDVKLKVIGHTDLTGDFTENQGLSERRANSVKEYFVSKGINSNRLVTEGKGSTEPLHNSKKEEFNKLNRRTEFQIVE